jgi:hypothetical protein
MATAAQIEANRRNSQKSTGPRTEEGKNRSRFNAVDHGCRANILVLPSEVFGEYEKQCLAWKRSLKPRNPCEEFLIERIVSLGLQADRIDQAETARLNRRMHFGVFEEDDKVDAHVIELGQKLFRDACGPQALHLQGKMGAPGRDGELHRVSDYSNAEDQPMRLVHGLKASGSGCQWLLDRWAELRGLLEKGMPWLAPDKLKAVRLLGRHPVDAYDFEDVARIYLASHVLLNEGGQPFQEILNELSPEEGARYEHYLQLRGYAARAPKDAAAARRMLLEIVDRATEVLEDRADVNRQLEEINLQTAGRRLSWDDTPEGERLRRYQMSCKRMWSRMFDLLMKVRSTGSQLDIATIESIRRSVPTVTRGQIDQPEPFVADVITPPEEPVNEPDPPSEPKSAGENAPNEPNSHAQAPSSTRLDGHKEFRIDTPHRDRKPGGIGITGTPKTHPVLERVLNGRNSTILNLTPIFGGQ